jgi:formate dehydrogenase subunit gamma
MLRLFGLIALMLTLAVPAVAQDAVPVDRRAETGGAQTLEDILRRQEGVTIEDSFRSDLTGNPEAAAEISDQLGTLGGASDPDLWRALRYNTADITTQTRGPAITTLMQDGGLSFARDLFCPLESTSWVAR